MEILIKIPEEKYKAIQKCHASGFTLGSLDMAILSGTVLPKGHGALKDVDAIVKSLKEEKKYYISSWGGFYNMPMTDKARCDEKDNCISEVINAPTIIEADREVKDEN